MLSGWLLRCFIATSSVSNEDGRAMVFSTKIDSAAGSDPLQQQRKAIDKCILAAGPGSTRHSSAYSRQAPVPVKLN